MKRSLTILLALSLLVAGCGGDDASEPESSLTDAERAWCSFDGATDESAFRFDQIFEAGLVEGLPMDALNAQASKLRTEYSEQGLSNDEAVRAVSEALLEEEVFVTACKAAYAANVG